MYICPSSVDFDKKYSYNQLNVHSNVINVSSEPLNTYLALQTSGVVFVYKNYSVDFVQL